jgi:hypothetical protein
VTPARSPRSSALVSLSLSDSLSLSLSLSLPFPLSSSLFLSLFVSLQLGGLKSVRGIILIYYVVLYCFCIQRGASRTTRGGHGRQFVRSNGSRLSRHPHRGCRFFFPSVFVFVWVGGVGWGTGGEAAFFVFWCFGVCLRSRVWGGWGRGGEAA